VAVTTFQEVEVCTLGGYHTLSRSGILYFQVAVTPSQEVGFCIFRWLSQPFKKWGSVLFQVAFTAFQKVGFCTLSGGCHTLQEVEVCTFSGGCHTLSRSGIFVLSQVAVTTFQEVEVCTFSGGCHTLSRSAILYFFRCLSHSFKEWGFVLFQVAVAPFQEGFCAFSGGCRTLCAFSGGCHTLSRSGILCFFRWLSHPFKKWNF
jgi:hypothetical protein